MTAREQLVKLIEDRGPIGLGHFMRHVLYHPEYGYYQTKVPIGGESDYITASEISQIFGELIAVWFYNAWQQLGSPDRIQFIEVGPGKGTFMKDFLRTVKKFKDFYQALTVHMIEVSDSLCSQQKRALGNEEINIDWHQNIQTVPEGVAFIFGNEFFDAFPIEQYMKASDGWKKRVVHVSEEGELSFAWSQAELVIDVDIQDGGILEVCLDGEGVAREIGARLREQGGVGLFIDYGYRTSSFQDSLQAIKAHRYAPVLSHLGEADLTHHVNFKALSEAFALMGVKVFEAVTQQKLLLDLGIEARTQHLVKRATPQQKEQLLTGSVRLVGSQHMGELFKAIAISSDFNLTPIGFDYASNH